MQKYYTGIGSRETPIEICQEMTSLATELEVRGYCLRSGNAVKADQSFQRGVKEKAEIWLPCLGFEEEFTSNYPNHHYRIVGRHDSVGEHDNEAWESVNKFHPAPDKLSEFGRAAMARNFRQLISEDGLNDSRFVICWTKDGKDSGGTGQALRIAKHYNIPILNMFNLSKEDVLRKINFMEFCEEE